MRFIEIDLTFFKLPIDRNNNFALIAIKVLEQFDISTAEMYMKYTL